MSMLFDIYLFFSVLTSRADLLPIKFKFSVNFLKTMLKKREAIKISNKAW